MTAAVQSVDHGPQAARWLRGVGVEIGAHDRPIAGIQPIYVDKFEDYAGQKCLADYYGDACELPFYDNSLDYVASSHVLEHTANPIKAICEWYRVLRPGGIMYLVVPDRRLMFDRPRALTPVAHLFEDYARGVSDADPTHIEDFLQNVDWSLFMPHIPPEGVAAEQQRWRELYHAELRAGRTINIHCHVFELATLLELFAELRTHPATRLRLAVVDRAEHYPSANPNGCLVVARKRPSPAGWIAAARARLLGRRPPGYPVLPTARPIGRTA